MTQVIVFYPDGWDKINIEAEFVPYSEIIMYRTFYPLLQKIDNTYLLVFDECMRVKNRSDLTYNCAHHYCNQTKHILVFEFFPFIDEPKDYMILLDLVDPNRYKGKNFSVKLLEEQPVSVIGHSYEFSCLDCLLDKGSARKYQAAKSKLFDNLGNRDPDTIPNALQLFVGRWKPIEPGKLYVARNLRKGKPNVYTFRAFAPSVRYRLIDLPMRQLVFNDFVKKSGCASLEFVHTHLNIDNYFYDRYRVWFKEVEKFNAEASLYEKKRLDSGAGAHQ